MFRRLAALLLCLAGCGRDALPQPRAVTAPLPPHTDPLVAERIAAARHPLEDGDGSASDWLELGMVYQANWYPELAQICYERAVALDESSAKAWFLLAAVRSERGRARGAIDAMERAVALAPEYAPARWRLGLLLLDAGDVDGAERALDRATELDLADPAGWCGLARVYLLQQRAAEAVELLELRVLHGPYGPYARHLLAGAYRQLGRLDDARAVLAAGTAASPPWRDAWTDEMAAKRTGLQPVRAAAERLIAMGRYPEAIARLEKLHAHWPDDVEVLNNLALALAMSGQRRRGLELLERSLAINPTYPRTHEARGRIHFAAGEFEAAITAYRAALEHDPRRAGLLVEIGRAQIALRRWERATETMESALQRDPGLGQAWLGLGIARMEAGDPAGAAAALDEAGRLIPRGDAARGVLERRRRQLRGEG